MLTGVATAVKETEKVSGDNYAFFEMKPGNQTAILSDGMGSGEKACQDSTLVVELMQQCTGMPGRKYQYVHAGSLQY